MIFNTILHYSVASFTLKFDEKSRLIDRHKNEFFDEFVMTYFFWTTLYVHRCHLVLNPNIECTVPVGHFIGVFSRIAVSYKLQKLLLLLNIVHTMYTNLKLMLKNNEINRKKSRVKSANNIYN